MEWKIIAISWCDWRNNDYAKDLSIDKFIVSQCHKLQKKALFIPTASWDNLDYCNNFRKIYESLWCDVNYLLLYSEQYNVEQIKSILDKTDIVYVSWWDTEKMLKKRNDVWLDELLVSFYLKWGILSGVSAWAICRFSWWLSDTWSIIQWLDLIKGNIVPHFFEDQSISISTIMSKSNIDGMLWLPDYSLFFKNWESEQIGVFKPQLNITNFSKNGINITIKTTNLLQWIYNKDSII